MDVASVRVPATLNSQSVGALAAELEAALSDVNAAVAPCSGLMDSVSGQVLTVDRGTSFFDNVMRLFEERDELGQ